MDNINFMSRSKASSLVDNLAKTLQKEPQVRVAVPGASAKLSHLGITYIYIWIHRPQIFGNSNLRIFLKKRV